MSALMKISEDKINRLETERKEAHRLMISNDYYREVKKATRHKQLEWLAVFQIVLSPSIACKKTEIPLSTYRTWRDTDPEFCKMWNEALDEVKSELEASVLSRATGYLARDENGEMIVDAVGRPIYQGGSDKLAVALLGLDRDTGQNEIVVNIEIVSNAR